MKLSIPTHHLLSAALLAAAPATQAQDLSEWLNPADGDWSDPLNWSTPDAPNNGGGTTYDALIAAGGVSPYTVELDNLTIAVDSLTFNDANATLSLVRSDLTIGVIDVMAGSIYTLGSTVTGAQVQSTGGSLPILWEIDRGATSPGSTFDAMQLSTSVTFFSNDSSTSLWLETALALDDGVVMRSELPRLFVKGGTAISTPGHATIELLGTMEYWNSFPLTSAQIGSGITIEMLGTDAVVEGDFDLHGVMRADGVGTLAEIESGVFDNFGTIEAVNGAVIVLNGVDNYGTLHVDTSSTLRIETRELRLHAGTQITGGGRLNLRSGQLDLNGHSIDLDQIEFTMDAGRLSNGTITSTNNTPLVFGINSFSNVTFFTQMTFETDVHLSNWYIRIEDGLTLANNAVIQNAAGNTGVYLDFYDAMTVSGTGRIQFGTGISALEMKQASGAVIFDTGIFIDSLHGDGFIGTDGKDWISRGTIAVGSGHALTFWGNWSNEGTLIVEDSAELVLGGDFATSDFGTVINQGGTIVIEGDLDNSGNTLDLLFVPGHVLVDGGTITGGRVQSSGSSVLDFGRGARLDRVELDVASTNARHLHIDEMLSIGQELEITVGSMGFGRIAGLFTYDDSGDGITYLVGNGTVTFRANPDPSVGNRAGISADQSETLEIGTDLTILQDNAGTHVFIGGPESSLVNAGTLDFRDGETSIDGQWSNQGTFQVSNNANVLLLGEYTTYDLLSIDYQGGDLRVAGTLDNSSAVLLKDTNTEWLVVNQTTHSAHPGDGVSILGGRIETADGQSIRNVASLDGVTLAGDVWLGDRNNGTIFNGLVFDGGTLHIVDPDNSLYTGLFSGTGTIQFDAGRYQPPVLRFNNTSDPFGSDITVQVGNINGTVGEYSYAWINQATLRSFNAGLDLRVEGEVTHNGTAHAEDGGSITFANLTNHGTLLAERGGIIRLEDGWTNPTGQINLTDGGILAVEAWSPTPGAFSLSEGVVRIEFDTDLAGLPGFPQHVDSFIDIAGVLDLGGGTLDLDALTSTLRLDGGTLLDGTVVGTSPLQITNNFASTSTLNAIQIHTDVQLGDTGTTRLRNATGFHASTITGDGELLVETTHTAAFDAATIESGLRINPGASVEITNGLTLNGSIRPGAGGGATPHLLITGAQTLAGTGEVNANTSAGLQIEFTGDLTVGPDVALAATQGTLDLLGATHTLDLQGRLTVAPFRVANITAAQWDNHGATLVNGSAALNVTADTINNHGAIELARGNLNVGDTDITNAVGALFAGKGVTNLGNAGTFHQHGDLEVVQASDARLLFLGHLTTHDTANTRITFDNNHSDTFAHIQATGDVALDGQLILDSESLVTLEAGDTLTLVLGGALTGVFDGVTGTEINPDLHWHLDYQPDRLIAQARLSGDTSGDGFVGMEDLEILLANWGQAVTAGDTFLGEWSGDGAIGDDDLQVVLSHWGQGTDPSAQVPEPGTLALLSLMLLTTRQRRRNV